MMYRSLYLVQQLKSIKAYFSTEPAKRIVQVFSLCLVMIFGTFCTPKSSSVAKLAASPTALLTSPTITETLSPTATAERGNSVPVLAYYYIWFDTRSWSRAKTDYPVLGHYSSDNVEVMRQHIQWAKNVGIDGFIVSWKGTEKLNRRLEQLVEVAEEENFKLAIIYEGLNFLREPLPLDQVDADMNYFVERYREHSVFDLFEKPVVIWSGTWKFSTPDIAAVVQDKQDDILVLASEKNVEGYQRLAEVVDGNAYYWSSVNPDTHPGYVEKLVEMGEVVHEDGGLWIAPAAPGFDARLVGGTRAIDRKEGETLQKQIEAALQSAPDAIGLISWNEFSENSHIEPSQDHGYFYLEVIAEILPLTPSSR